VGSATRTREVAPTDCGEKAGSCEKKNLTAQSPSKEGPERKSGKDPRKLTGKRSPVQKKGSILQPGRTSTDGPAAQKGGPGRPLALARAPEGKNAT